LSLTLRLTSPNVYKTHYCWALKKPVFQELVVLVKLITRARPFQQTTKKVNLIKIGITSNFMEPFWHQRAL